MNRPFAVICLLVMLAHPAQAEELYVCPAGNDSHAGTADKPFQTLARARDAVRKISRDMREDIVVYLDEG